MEATDYRGAMGIAIGGWDNDGDADVFLTQWTYQERSFR